MRKVIQCLILFFFVTVLGCAKVAPPTVENNIFISSSVPKIKIRVESEMPFIERKKINPTISDSGGSESTVGLVQEKYIFGSKNGTKVFVIEKQSFRGSGKNWDMMPIDYSQEPEVLESGKFRAGDDTYRTGIFLTDYKGLNYFHKYYSRLIGKNARLIFSYTLRTYVVFHDPKHLSESERQRVSAFSRMADSSFEILSSK